MRVQEVEKSLQCEHFGGSRGCRTDPPVFTLVDPWWTRWRGLRSRRVEAAGGLGRGRRGETAARDRASVGARRLATFRAGGVGELPLSLLLATDVEFISSSLPAFSVKNASAPICR